MIEVAYEEDRIEISDEGGCDKGERDGERIWRLDIKKEVAGFSAELICYQPVALH